ncbi:(2Fe-2S)-binding protein [Haladaptatus sp. DJG-WS-42]|uniref:(2Fe-2S)-binding protein n=1 Tax=Haladaptatus sp. DJG-WS-42 TaxID=3120516 RepID=UPI0030D600E4
MMSEPNPSVAVTMTLNGQAVTETIPARTTLSEYLREYRRLTGVHRGCETVKCGACTVLVDGRSVKSCNMLAAQANGHEVTTVEGLATDGHLTAMQQAFLDNHGMQCGYCTPGFVLAAIALVDENDAPSVDEVRHGLTGNICRCTGYTKIVESVLDAADRMRGDDS